MAPPDSKPAASPVSQISRLRALGERRPRLRIGFSTPLPAAGTLRLVLPFRRSWPAIIVAGVFLAGFSVPLFSVLGQMGSQDGGLFSLVFVLFHLFWGVGWSVGVGIIALVFLALLMGREVVVVRPDAILVRLEILGFGVGGEYEAKGISNLRPALPDADNGTSWRGPHLAFDYYGVQVSFGSDLAGGRATEIINLVRSNLNLSPVAHVIPDAPPDSSPVIAETRPGDKQDDPELEGPPPGLTELATGLEDEISSLSTVALIIANLVPLAGVWLLEWDVGEIMLLYWAESGIIGVFNLIKLAVVGKWAALFYGPFFVGHYGAFMAGHLLFIYTFFVQGPGAKADIAVAEVAGHFIALWPALLALAVSHGISFVINFMGRREYAETTVQKQMAEPYGRIIIMHLTIIFGGFVVMGLGSSLSALLLLMVAKIIADLRAHKKQRK